MKHQAAVVQGQFASLAETVSKFLRYLQTDGTVLLVRRKAKSVPPDLCARVYVDRISWVDTVLLNLVLQIAFRLTVTISRYRRCAFLTLVPL